MPIQSNQKEEAATKFIPYDAPLDAYTCTTTDWDVLRTIKVAGVPFETLSKESMNGLTQQLFSTLNGMGAKNARVALWTHMIRRKINYDLSEIRYDNHFSQLLNQQYAERLGKEDFYINEMFVTPVYRPAASAAERFAQSFSKNAEHKRATLQQAKSEIEAITNQLMISLKRYQPTLLGTSETEDGVLHADYAELYARILNGAEAAPVAINRYPIRYAIQRSGITFDGDVVVIERPASTRYAAILSLKAPYSIEKIRPNILHGLLQLKCEFILSQSLTFMQAGKAERFLQQQLGQITSTTNNKTQIKELEDAIDGIQNGKFGMGEHEFILTIFADSISDLNIAVAEANSAFEQRSLEVFRETRGGLIAQYFGMLPGNFRMKRYRAQPISTANFVSLFPMHNYVTGNANGSQWGMPIAMMKTNGESPYFFNYHVSRQALKDQGAQLEYDPEEDDVAAPANAASSAVDTEEELNEGEITQLRNEGEQALPKRRRQRKDSGNYIAIGPNGSGKTVIQCLLRALARKVEIKRGPYKTFTFDKDSGQEIFICALGGRYFRFTKGVDSNINPFSLPDNERTHLFLVNMAKWCAAQDQTYIPSTEDENELLKSVREVYRLKEGRRWARIGDTLKSKPLKSALQRWWDGGAYSWVLDNEVDRFDLTVANDFGFDMTEFLEDDLARPPILRYLKYKIDLSAPGSPYSIEMDEASVALKDEMLRDEFVEKEARTIRKKEGIIGLGVQDASDITEGPLKGVLTTQFPNLLVFPNGQAERKYYVDGLKLTEAEFEQVTVKMHEKPGSFLLKRGIESVVVQVDLSGMNDVLAVLSGSSDNLPLVRGLIKIHGDNPEAWLPEFFKRRQ
jgi:type IV secretion system protein VirB4